MNTSKLFTAIEYVRNWSKTGAIRQSTEAVEKEICKYITPNKSQIIVEFGAGHGNITNKILQTMSPDSKLYSFEIIDKFCDKLRTEITDPRLTIINDSALTVSNYLKTTPCCIISSMPLTIMPQDVKIQILDMGYEVLPSSGTFSQILYSPTHVKKLKPHFDEIEHVVVSKFPMSSVYHCHKK